MAEVLLLLFVLMFSSLGKTAERLVYLECEAAVGVIGQNTMISCYLRSTTVNTTQIIITAAAITKAGEEDPLFEVNRNNVTGDLQFKLPSPIDSGFMTLNTKPNDEGEYENLFMMSHVFDEDGKFRISFTGKYNKPVMRSRTEQIVDGGGAELFCEASGGFPAGTIHWFDKTNTNWTNNSELKITQREDKLFHLTSKLTFTSFNSSWSPFRCVVLNSRFEEEVETTIYLQIKDHWEPVADSESSVALIVAPIAVTGSLIGLLVGLLIALLLRRRRFSKTQYFINRAQSDRSLNNDRPHF